MANLDTIYIGFSTPRIFNPVSWVVRKLTKSSASHTWLLYFDSDLGIHVVMEAHELGFRILPFKRFSEHNKVVAVIDPVWPIHDVGDKTKDGLKYLSSFLGSAYDWFGLLGNSIVIIGKWLKLKWHNPFVGPKAMFCSEANTRVLQLVSFPNSKELNPDDTSPQDLLNFLNKSDTKLVSDLNMFI